MNSAHAPISLLDVDPMPAQDSGPVIAHIVPKHQILPGYVNGTPVDALCGETFIPTRDPDQLPMCQECETLLGAIRSRG